MAKRNSIRRRQVRLSSGGGIDLAALDEKIAAYYSLESDGSDSVGSNDLTENNTPSYVTGIVDNAASLAKASSESLSRASGGIFNLLDDFTVGFWVKPVTVDENSYALFSKGDAADPPHKGVFIFITDEDLFGAMVEYESSAGTITITTDITPVEGEWYFVCLSYSTTEGYRFRVSTVEEFGDAYSGDATTTVNENTRAMYVGAVPLIGTPGLHSDIIVDELFICNSFLTEEEEEYIWNSGAGIAYPYSS